MNVLCVCDVLYNYIVIMTRHKLNSYRCYATPACTASDPIIIVTENCIIKTVFSP